MREELLFPFGVKVTTDGFTITSTWLCKRCQVEWEPEQVEWEPEQIMLTPMARCPKCKSKLYVRMQWKRGNCDE